MSRLDKRIHSEVGSLVEAGLTLLRKAQSSPNALAGDDLIEITSWVTRLGQLIRRLYGEKSQHFEAYSSALTTTHFYSLHSNWNAHFSQMIGVVKAIRHDLDNGLLVDFKNLVQADVFADFLEMGEYLLNEGYKDAAAVIVGSVLEDGLRKLAENRGIALTQASGKPLTIEPLNVELAKQEVYSKLVQKQITSWAHIRNKAAHGEFGEYNQEQVQMMLLFVQGFSAEHLG
jgi:uncharacterized protein (DUF2164 family)